MIKFRKGGTYRHVRAMDVDIYVLNVSFRGPKYTRLKVAWFNKRGQPLNVLETITVIKEQYENWNEVEGD